MIDAGPALQDLVARLAVLEIGLHLAAAPPAPGHAAPDGRTCPPPGRSTAAAAARRELRLLLSRQSAGRVPPGSWTLAWNGSGRPLVTGPEPGFHASVTYAPALFGVAAARGRRLGMDLEPERPMPADDMPLHLLSPAETALVKEDPSHFLRIWTLKEAFAKERGEGLLVDCTALDVEPWVGAETSTIAPRPDGGVAVHTRFRLGDETYLLALTAGPARG